MAGVQGLCLPGGAPDGSSAAGSAWLAGLLLPRPLGWGLPPRPPGYFLVRILLSGAELSLALRIGLVMEGPCALCTRAGHYSS